MIRFPCPHCNAALKAPDDGADQKSTCPGCQRSVTVPLSLDDEAQAAEIDTRGQRKIPRWAGVVGGLLTTTALVVVVVMALSGPQDGMTRAERRAFETNFRRELVGVWDAKAGRHWEQVPEGSRHIITFTGDGRFEAVRYSDGKKVGSHGGKWLVTGNKLTIEITESGDVYVGTSKMVPSDILEVKNEKGRMFMFYLDRYQGGGYHTFTRATEPPKPKP